MLCCESGCLLHAFPHNRWYEQAKEVEGREGDKQNEQVPREALAAANTQAPAIIINAQARSA